MSTVTLQKIKYEDLKQKAALFERIVELAEKDQLFSPLPFGLPVVPSRVKTIYLKGRAAKKLDRRVEKAMKEYRGGKTKKIRSVADLM